MLRFVLLFLAIAGALLLLDIYEPFYQAVVAPFTSLLATVSAAIMHVFDGSVIHVGKQLYGAGGKGISIERGCNGVEAVIILIAAVVAYPSTWQRKVVGIVLGFLAIQALNVVRIISLFYLQQWDENWFRWFHLYLWQSLIVLDALIVFLVWLRSLPPEDAPPGGDAPPPAAATT